jgi:AhpD family alkylhydroperoxidase
VSEPDWLVLAEIQRKGIDELRAKVAEQATMIAGLEAERATWQSEHEETCPNLKWRKKVSEQAATIAARESELQRCYACIKSHGEIGREQATAIEQLTEALHKSNDDLENNVPSRAHMRIRAALNKQEKP